MCAWWKNLPATPTRITLTAFPKPTRWISIRLTAARRAAATSTCAIMQRIYDLPTVVFRQSCIYGPRQFGVEDQGWVAWFVIAALTGKPITVYGDGKQVRDVLYVEDLLNAYDAAVAQIDHSAGKVFNVGGGAENILAIWTEFGPLLEKLAGKTLPTARGDWRPGDQRVFVADVRKAEAELGWRPQVGVEEGIRRLYRVGAGESGFVRGVITQAYANPYRPNLLPPSHQRFDHLRRAAGEGLGAARAPGDRVDFAVPARVAPRRNAGRGAHCARAGGFPPEQRGGHAHLWGTGQQAGAGARRDPAAPAAVRRGGGGACAGGCCASRR